MWEIVALIVVIAIAVFYFSRFNIKATKKVPEVVSDLKVEEKEEELAEPIEVTDEVSIEKMLSEANKRFEEGDIDEAEKIFIEIIKRDRKNQRAFYGLGNILLAEKNYKDASIAFQRAVYFNDDDDMAYSNLGLSYYKLGHFDKAIDCLQRAININSDPQERYLYLAQAAKKNRDHKLAIKTLEQLTNLGESNDIKQLKFLAEEYEILGQRDKAMKVWTHILELDPEDVEIKRKVKLTH